MPRRSKQKSIGQRLDRVHFAQIHVAKAQLEMDDQTYRGVLTRIAGVNSSRDLDIDGFNAVMNEFARLGFVSTATRERHLEKNRSPDHSTHAQRTIIQRLWRAWSGRNDSRGLSAWLMKKFKVSNVRFLSVEQAQKAIGALRNFKPQHRGESTQPKGE